MKYAIIPALLLSLAAPAAALAASGLEPGEDRPGGATTHHKALNADAFSHPSANMAFAREMDFKVGNGFFRRLWVTAPASTRSADGLGPLFNARACQNCHVKDGRGRPPEPGEEAVSMFLRLSVPPSTEAERALLAAGRAPVIPEPAYGGQLQNFAIAGHAGEGRMDISYTTFSVRLAGGEVTELRRPRYAVADPAYGPLRADAMLSPRVTPAMIGLGLLEAIPEADLLAKADPDDKDGDGISGRARMSWGIAEQRKMIGRFGWKAGNPTVQQQSADAFNGDIGLSNPLFPSPSGDCTPAQTACAAAPNGNGGAAGEGTASEATAGAEKGGGFEVSQKVLDLVGFYARNLAVPPRRDPADPQVLRGKAAFHAAGCAGCHTPRQVTATLAERPEQSGQVIWPYTDLLLHDMGDGLADNRPEGEASGSEWKTPPLWGIGLLPVVNRHQFLLHDGRARTVLEAILWHDGEARAARDKVAAMTKAERAALIRFVNSL